jgi:hypothetical protein
VKYRIRQALQRLSVLAVLTSLVFLGGSPCWAEKPLSSADYPALKMASAFSRTVQAVTGFTPLSGWIANRIIRKELSKHVQGDLHSHLTLFSGTDLLGRKAKTLTISGHNVLLGGFVPLTDFQLTNLPDKPFVLSAGKRPILLRPVQFKLSIVMTEADMNQMLHSEKGRAMLTAIKLNLPPFGAQAMDMLNPVVALDGDKMIIQTLMNMHDAPPENALPVTVSGRLAAQDSRLKLSSLDLRIEGVQDTDAMAPFIENYFGELVNLNHLKIARHRVKAAVQTSELADHRLHLEALLTIEPQRKALEKALKAASR